MLFFSATTSSISRSSILPCITMAFEKDRRAWLRDMPSAPWISFSRPSGVSMHSTPLFRISWSSSSSSSRADGGGRWRITLSSRISSGSLKDGVMSTMDLRVYRNFWA